VDIFKKYIFLCVVRACLQNVKYAREYQYYAEEEEGRPNSVLAKEKNAGFVATFRSGRYAPFTSLRHSPGIFFLGSSGIGPTLFLLRIVLI